ncbi:MAG: ExeA family protein [Myxococcota bacterium]
MSAYLKFFELEQSPFEGVDQSKVVLGTQALRDAFATIQTGLDEGASRVFINGGPGVGKTSFARAMPKLLGDETRVASISDPSAPWESLRGGIAMQWGLDERGLARNSLLEAAEDHRLLLVIDQAEQATEEFLDHLDVLLSYKDEFADPVVQSVILGQLSGAGSAESCPLVWWLDRIQTLQLEYAPLPREGVAPYIRKHLKRAGWRGGRLFTDEAALSIHGWTGGIPGEVSTLCEQLLVEAADCSVEVIGADFVDLFKEDNETTAEEAPWDFGQEFDEFEPDEALASQLLEELKEDVPFDLEDEADSIRTDENENEEASGETEEADANALSIPKRPGLERAALAEASEADRENEERLASQKAALPRGLGSPPPLTERPKLQETLELFEDAPLTDEAKNGTLDAEGFDPNATTNSKTHAELEALEQALSAPASAGELREIQGGFAAAYARPLAIGALIAILGGLAFAFFFGGNSGDRFSGNQNGTPTVLGRVNGPADSMPPAKDTRVRLQNALPPRAENSAGRSATTVNQPESSHQLARVGPRLKRAGSQPLPSTPASKAQKKRLQEKLEAEDRKEVQTDLRPEGLSGTDLDLSENRNR